MKFKLFMVLVLLMLIVVTLSLGNPMSDPEPESCLQSHQFECWHGPDFHVEMDCGAYDIDGDWDVDLVDFAIYQSECQPPYPEFIAD